MSKDTPQVIEIEPLQGEGAWDMILTMVALAQIWQKMPQLRLMQMLQNALGPGDHYYVKNVDLVQKLCDFYEIDPNSLEWPNFAKKEDK